MILFADCEFLRQFIGLATEFFDVDIFEGEYADALYKAIGAVDVPNPDVLHVELEVEVGWSVDAV